MALLDNAYVKQSRQVLREYKPVIPTFNSIINPDASIAQHTVDIPCVEVQIPERDWNKIVEIVQAHERAIKNPAVQDAWDQYLVIRHLTDQNLPKR